MFPGYSEEFPGNSGSHRLEEEEGFGEARSDLGSSLSSPSLLLKMMRPLSDGHGPPFIAKGIPQWPHNDCHAPRGRGCTHPEGDGVCGRMVLPSVLPALGPDGAKSVQLWQKRSRTVDM